MSVVVMGYRNEATAVAALRSLVDQVGSQPVELVFVTSGGDRSAELVRTDYPNMTLVESAIPLLPGATRNTGVAATTGAVVAFLEADCVAEPGWVAGRLAAHHAGHRAVASAMTHHAPGRPSAWAAHYVVFRARLPGRPSGAVDYPNPAAHGLSFDRDVLELVGPFDERARIGEDTEAARRLRDMGIGAWFESNVRTAHRGPQSFRAMVRDLYDRGERYAAVDASAEPITVPRGAAQFVPSWLRRLRGIVLSAWRNGRGERWRIVVCLPWIAIGAAAHLAGYTVARIRER